MFIECNDELHFFIHKTRIFFHKSTSNKSFCTAVVIETQFIEEVQKKDPSC